MDILILIIMGVIGGVVGYKIPMISIKIIEYKRRKIYIDNSNSFLYSKWFKILMCIFNSSIWMISWQSSENKLICMLIALQITIGIIVAFIDVSNRIIPNELVVTLIIVGIIFQIVFSGYRSLGYAVISMIVMMAIFMSVAGFVGLGKVGAGDVKLAGVMGLALGYPLIINALLVMSITLLVFIVTGLLMKQIYMSTMLPLAPFMIAGYAGALIRIIV